MVKYKKYEKENLQAAVRDVNNGMSLRKAATLHNIGHITIRRHVLGELKGQPVRVLTPEEELALHNYIIYSQERALPLNVKMIKLFVRSLVKKSGRKNNIGSNGPSNKWFRSFLKRHPDLKMRSPQTIDGGRVRMSNSTVMNRHFNLLRQTMEKFGLLNKPGQIFNVDETGFGKNAVVQEKVCTGTRQTYSRQVMTASHTTATLCVSAAGQVLPTFVIYEKTFPSGAYRDGIPENWLFGVSPNGYMDSQLFFKWFEQIFLAYAPKQRPLLLIMDNHESHLSIEVIEKARLNQVELYCLPPHTTHILQPLDVVLFRPLKKAVSELSLNLGYANPSLIIGKNRFAQILRAAVDKSFSAYNIKMGFQKCGIHPLNEDAIDKTKLAPVDPEYISQQPSNMPGPTGDNQICLDPLCESCGQFVSGHPLVKQGLIPSQLADIFIPITGKKTVQKKSRIITESRVITGDEIYAQLKEKETKTTRKEKGSNRLQPCEETCINSQLDSGRPTKRKDSNARRTRTDSIQPGTDDLPIIRAPKRMIMIQQKKASQKHKEIYTPPQKSGKNKTLADPQYTCLICHQRGMSDDEEHGILWVGCDNSDCGLWYHRDCLNYHQQVDVDLSLLLQSSWCCHLCSINTSSQSVEIIEEDTCCTSQSVNFICQVCMSHEKVMDSGDKTIYWATCKHPSCGKSYHQSCLPSNVFREFECSTHRGIEWFCGQCPV